MLPYILIIVISALLGACSASAPQVSEGEKPLTADTAVNAMQVIKSASDDRAYRYIVLPNKMRVLLISDSATEKSAVALNVLVGSADNPSDRLGLAHFLEHMLFLGTEKYPQPGEYQDYITAHGGSMNAYTSFEHTNYFFSVTPEYLDPAIDRFAQFFIAPLFNREYVDRERNAVDAEYHLGLKHPQRRVNDVFRHIANPDHPISQFHVGSLTTLDGDAEELRNDLLAFYRQHYSANQMTLVVLGRESLSALTALVEEKFSTVKNYDKAEPHIAPTLFTPNSLPLRITMHPLQDRRELRLVFPLPDILAYTKSKPLSYIGEVMGHEGQGSVLSYLKERNWATGLSAGVGLNYRGGSVFNISVEMTDEGMAHQTEVSESIFYALNMLRERGIVRWFFDEQQALHRMQFRFLEKTSPLQYVYSLAEQMFYYPPAEILRGAYIAQQYRADLITDFVNRLTPDNALILVVNKDALTDSTSTWYHVPYMVQDVGDELLARWMRPQVDAAIRLPSPNPFIARNLAVKTQNEEAQSTPDSLSVGDEHRYWHYSDHQYDQPKGVLYVYARFLDAAQSPKQYALASLYIAAVDEQLNEFKYPALLAGLHYDMRVASEGYVVRITGFSDRQPLLLYGITQTLANPQLTHDRFEAVKKKMIRDWRNTAQSPPYQQVIDRARSILTERTWRYQQLADAAEELQWEDVRQLSVHWSQPMLEVLISGNYTRTDARRIKRLLSKWSDKPATTALPQLRFTRLIQQEPLWRRMDIDHDDSVLLLYVQGKDDRPATRAAMALTHQIVKSAFFNELRTERQLGYVVAAVPLPLAALPGLAFLVESAQFSTQRLWDETDQFLRRLVDGDDDSEKFEQHKKSLLDILNEPAQNIGALSSRYWDNLLLRNTQFDNRDQLIAALAEIDLPKWKEFVIEHFAVHNRRQLILYSGEKIKDSTHTTAPTQYYTFP